MIDVALRAIPFIEKDIALRIISSLSKKSQCSIPIAVVHNGFRNRYKSCAGQLCADTEICVFQVSKVLVESSDPFMQGTMRPKRCASRVRQVRRVPEWCLSSLRLRVGVHESQPGGIQLVDIHPTCHQFVGLKCVTHRRQPIVTNFIIGVAVQQHVAAGGSDTNVSGIAWGSALVGLYNAKVGQPLAELLDYISCPIRAAIVYDYYFPFRLTVLAG